MGHLSSETTSAPRSRRIDPLDPAHTATVRTLPRMAKYAI